MRSDPSELNHSQSGSSFHCTVYKCNTNTITNTNTNTNTKTNTNHSQSGSSFHCTASLHWALFSPLCKEIHFTAKEKYGLKTERNIYITRSIRAKFLSTVHKTASAPYFHCISTVFPPYFHCISTVFPLYFHCISTVFSVHFHCISTKPH